MKFDIQNPAFLQVAGNHLKVMRMTTSVEDQEFFELSANGVVYIDSIKNGEKVRKTLVSPNNEFVAIENDADTEIVVWGDVTYLNAGDDGNTGLTFLDASKNNALTHLNCISCTGLTSLDFSKNTALTSLECGYCTGLTSLDVSKNNALTSLNCYSCTGLTSLDVSKNNALTHLNCDGCTGLTSLDFSKNTSLTYLNCNGCTGLTSLDVSKNNALTILNCVGCTGLTSLDFSKNTALDNLGCNGCTGLMLLDIQNTALLRDGSIVDQGMENLTTIQLNGTSKWAQGQIGGWLEQYAPTGGKLYADQDTLQEVLVAAEDKDWTIEYVA